MNLSSVTQFPYVFCLLDRRGLDRDIYHVVVLSTDYELEANYFISALTLNIYSL